MMGSMKASLLLYFVFFLYLQHHFSQATSRSTTRFVTAAPSHDNLQVQSVESKHDGDAFSDKTAELAVVVKKGGGRGGGGRGGGGGGRSSGGGGRSGGTGERSMGRGGVFPVAGGGGGGRRSRAVRTSASVWLGLATLLGFALGF